ncbi:hypothetical protein J6X90_02325 [Candidatus Saccharibacteria bacterium]|nr:hypothetical protein [Candidatus Saccharibacteria bacterium]
MSKKQTREYNGIISKLSVFAGSLLITAFAVYFYSPVIKSHADSHASESLDVKLNVAPAIAIHVDKSELNLDANFHNPFVQGSVNVDVTTNSAYGFSLGLEDMDSDTNLVHESTNVDDVLTSNFLGSKTGDDMDDNTWGFSLDSTNFYRMNPNGKPIRLKTTNSPTPADPGYNRTQVDFGAKIDMYLTAGVYADTVIFTAYVNGVDGNPSNGTVLHTKGESPYRAMQGFDCTAINSGDTETLVDLRDGQEYNIIRAGDYCWMKENLNLKGPAQLTPTLSSVSEWDLEPEEEGGEPAEYVQLPASSLQGFIDPIPYKEDWSYKIAPAYYDNGAYGGLYNRTASRIVCPRGWELPSYYDSTLSDLYNYLYPNGEGNVDLTESAVTFSKGGYIDDGVLTSVGTEGFYWAREVDERRYWRSYVIHAALSDGYYLHNIDGMAVRCIINVSGSDA